MAGRRSADKSRYRPLARLAPSLDLLFRDLPASRSIALEKRKKSSRCRADCDQRLLDASEQARALSHLFEAAPCSRYDLDPCQQIVDRSPGQFRRRPIRVATSLRQLPRGLIGSCSIVRMSCGQSLPQGQYTQPQRTPP